MFMFYKLKLKLSEKSGMTLVETIVGFSLLAIASTMLLTGFMTCASLIKEANDFKTSSARVATVIDVEDTEIMGEPETVNISVANARVEGLYYFYKDEKTGLKYKVFVPQALQNNAEDN